MAAPDPLPDDLAAAHALIQRLSAQLAEKDEKLAHRDIELARLNTILKKLQRRQFAAKSERLAPEQMALGLEDIEAAIGTAEAHEEARNPALKSPRAASRRRTRGKLPAHLPRVEIVVDVEDKACPCCGAGLHAIGEDVSERLDVIPSQFRVLVTRRLASGPLFPCVMT